MNYEIVKNIPPPDRWEMNRKYPWRKLEVGDCMVIPNQLDWKRFRQSVYNLNKKCQGSPLFTTKIQDEKLHIWRVK